jgi:hypothetical protein
MKGEGIAEENPIFHKRKRQLGFHMPLKNYANFVIFQHEFRIIIIFTLNYEKNKA